MAMYSEMLNMKKSFRNGFSASLGDLCNFETLKSNQSLPKSCSLKLNTLSHRL